MGLFANIKANRAQRKADRNKEVIAITLRENLDAVVAKETKELTNKLSNTQLSPVDGFTSTFNAIPEDTPLKLFAGKAVNVANKENQANGIEGEITDVNENNSFTLKAASGTTFRYVYDPKIGRYINEAEGKVYTQTADGNFERDNSYSRTASKAGVIVAKGDDIRYYSGGKEINKDSYMAKLSDLQKKLSEVPIEKPTLKAGNEKTKLTPINPVLKPGKTLVNSEMTIEQINEMQDDKEKIIQWRKMNASNQKENYVIVDKKSCQALVYSADGSLLKTFEVGIAKRSGDGVGNGGSLKGKINDIEMYTTAGEFVISDPGKSKDNVEKFSNNVLDLKGFGYEQGNLRLAIHQVPNGAKERNAKFHNNTLEDNRMSAGCVNLLANDFAELQKLAGINSNLYILPEEDDNKLQLKASADGTYKFINDKYEVTQGKIAAPLTINVDDSLSGLGKRKATQFASSLMENKQELMNDLNINNATYDKLAKLSMGIAGAESEFGSGIKYFAKETAPGIVTLARKFLGKKGGNSRGMTQMKIESYTDKSTKELLEKYDINPDNLVNADKSAKATMIVLSAMYKNELNNHRAFLDDKNISDEEALMYLWNGRHSQLKTHAATPDKNLYVQAVKENSQRFTFAYI